MSYEEQQAYLLRLLEECEEDEVDHDVYEFFEDDSETEWLPPAPQENNEDSDIEDVVTENVTINVSDDEHDSDEEDCEIDETEGHDENISSSYTAKDGTLWRRNPPQRQTLRHNILRNKNSGPSRSTNMFSIKDTFKCIFSDVICNIVIRETNRKAKEVYEAYNLKNRDITSKKWKILSNEEFEAYLAVLINAGVHRSNNEHATVLWATTSSPLYRASMGLNRFREISRFLRFDNPHTRASRLETDKTAAISDIFELLNANLRNNYTPSECLVVDEQLFPFRGKYCYVPWCCVSIYFYLINFIIV